MTQGLTVAIVTYKRAAICLETILLLLPILKADDELIVVEQECDEVRQQFTFSARCPVKFIVLPKPGMVEARNAAIQNCERSILVFLDDDVVPSPTLLEAHAAAYSDTSVGAVAGRILGPLDISRTDTDAAPQPGWLDTDFAMQRRAWVEGARGCNMSFRRDLLVSIGGFDTGFNRPFFFREETDVCFRVREAGFRILFEPDAMLRHLEAKSGGTRSQTPKTPSALIDEFSMYRKHFCHYRDNLYLILKHFHGSARTRHLWQTYRAYVGISRWPWRLLAKNCCFLTALLNAFWIKRRTHAPYFSATPVVVIHLPVPSASEGAA